MATDPTDGYVNYGTWDDLITVSGEYTKIAAGPPSGGPRRMIRLVSTECYDSGLFIMDCNHIPEGLSTWPSFWLTSAVGTWSCNGEIDIIEGVNSIDASSSMNAVTLHTNDRPGVQCRQSGVPNIVNTDCTASTGGHSCGCDNSSPCPNIGCGVKPTFPNSFGKGFNSSGGGVYACELTPGGKVTVWFFPVGKVPADITTGSSPDPTQWPTTYRTQFNACPGQFSKMQIVVNTTLCGGWAGNVYPGGSSACTKYVQTADLSQAYWNIKYIKVFLQQDRLATDVSPEGVPPNNAGKCQSSVPATGEGENMFQYG